MAAVTRAELEAVLEHLRESIGEVDRAGGPIGCGTSAVRTLYEDAVNARDLLRRVREEGLWIG